MDWAWWYHPPLSSAEGANGLELYLRLPSANAKACHGSTFTFTYNLKTNVDISKERQISAFEISDSAFEMLNDTCLWVSLNNSCYSGLVGCDGMY